MCGEKGFAERLMAFVLGSPPHVRGKAVLSSHWFDAMGITPACAGKSPRLVKSHISDMDHPRMCGEKASREIFQTSRRGSPPHVRGKVDVLPEIDPLVGITPAYAGKRRRGAQ